jgi:hypothetical protein
VSLVAMLRLLLQRARVVEILPFSDRKAHKCCMEKIARLLVLC